MNQNITDSYRQLLEQHTQTLARLNRKHNIITALRLLAAGIAIVIAYQYINDPLVYKLYIIIACALLFFFLLNRSQKISRDKQLYKNLIRINNEEIAYLQEEGIPFESGREFVDNTHVYTADLDIFGERSLFHHLNRTATYIGKLKLSVLFSAHLSKQQILDNQQSVKELCQNIRIRQRVLALARITEDSKETYQKITEWTKKEGQKVNLLIKILSFLLPAALAVCLVVYFFTRQELYWDTALRLMPVNLFVMFTQLKNIRKAMFGADQANEILNQYAAILQVIEQAKLESPGLKTLQAKLQSQGGHASEHIKKLSKISNDMSSIQNPFGAVILNALFLYHIHTWHRLIRWKKKYAEDIIQWTEVIGEWETLSSLANLAYNNPQFAYPILNEEGKISFEQLGHPMIPERKRVCNSVSFNDHSFIILTGSNMAGKSTFLRSLGINMVLASVGSVVCATRAEIQPMPLLVSMRQSDSLADNESYFFAEVKKLKYIIDQIKAGGCFVLLDEILRGTNSDDKRSGTIAIIRKMIEYKTTGVIFDYKLRNGICKNKSATFLMKKMGVI